MKITRTGKQSAKIYKSKPERTGAVKEGAVAYAVEVIEKHPSRDLSKKIESRLGRIELELLMNCLGTQSKVAELLNVNRSSVCRWLSSKPDPANLLKISELSLIFQKLHSVFQPQTAAEWLYGVNAHLGNQKPIDLAREGRIAEVLAAIEQEETLAYA
jgi:hypothetical protein